MADLQFNGKVMLTRTDVKVIGGMCVRVVPQRLHYSAVISMRKVNHVFLMKYRGHFQILRMRMSGCSIKMLFRVRIGFLLL